MPDEQGRHRRAEMEAIIKAGGSINTRGQIITKIAELPTDAELARGDSAREVEVAGSLQEQMAELQRQMALLGQAKPPETAPKEEGTDTDKSPVDQDEPPEPEKHQVPVPVHTTRKPPR